MLTWCSPDVLNCNSISFSQQFPRISQLKFGLRGMSSCVFVFLVVLQSLPFHCSGIEHSTIPSNIPQMKIGTYLPPPPQLTLLNAPFLPCPCRAFPFRRMPSATTLHQWDTAHMPFTVMKKPLFPI